MSTPRSRTVGATLAVVLTTVTASGLVAASGSLVVAGAARQAPLASSPDGVDRLDKADALRVTRAEETGERTVTVLVAADAGDLGTVVSGLQALGATIDVRNTRVDYVRAEVPTRRARSVPALDGVSAVDVDDVVPLRTESARVGGPVAPAPQPAPGRRAPRVNPYLPTADTGAAQLAERPGFDGSGTTVAVLGSGIDPTHPALRLPDGSRKVVDVNDAIAVNDEDGTWVRMAGSYRGSFQAAGRTWQPPSGGPYAFGVLVEDAGDLAVGELEGDLDRDGVRGETFGVLQDVDTKEVLVDVDGDGDFRDQRRMLDYRREGEIGYLGRDRAATRVVERVPFVVQTDRSRYVGDVTPYVNIGIAASHGTHLAGVAAGRALFGGAMAGAAPGARLMSVKACYTTEECTNSGLLEGVLYAARRGADVILVPSGSPAALNDAFNARAELYDRTIAEFGVQIVGGVSDAGPGLNTVADPAIGDDVLGVAATLTDATWRANAGVVTDVGEAVAPFSSRGPREDGGLSPRLAAPGSAVSTTPRWLPGSPAPGTYPLAPGYGTVADTSVAAAQVAGAAALLVGAYEDEYGERPSPAELRTALTSSARFLDASPAHAQGAGVVDVAGAWDLLVDDVDADEVTTSVPVSTVLSGLLATPGVGVGIHDREGVDGPYTRTYTLTRRTGPAGTRSYDVSWVGDDGTFDAPDAVALPLGTPVTLDVEVDPTSPGVHSALMRLDDPATVGVDASTLNTVVVPGGATEDEPFVTTRSGELGPTGTDSVFVDVPEGASALRVELDGGGADAGAGQLRFARLTPEGVPLDRLGPAACYVPDAGGSCPDGDPASRTVLDPAPGVWEVAVEASPTSDSPTAAWTLTASVLDASVAPDPDVLDPVVVGAPVQRRYTATNEGARFDGRLVGGPLSSAALRNASISDLGSQQYQIPVGTGATALEVTIGDADPGADLDLSVFRCTTSCTLVGQSADGDSEESVRLVDPPAATYIALVDAYTVPGGTTSYSYRDVVSSPGFGSIAVTDVETTREPGASWSVPATVTAQAVPPSGRLLLGTVRVVDDGGRTLGTGEVRIPQVTGP